MAQVSFTVPDGYTPVCIAIPDEDVPDTVAAFDQIAGYIVTVHGDTDAVRIQMAVEGMGDYLNHPVIAYRTQVALANAEADGRKIMALLPG